jgi:hypothetical protein
MAFNIFIHRSLLYLWSSNGQIRKSDQKLLLLISGASSLLFIFFLPFYLAQNMPLFYRTFLLIQLYDLMSFHCGNVFIWIRTPTNVFSLELFLVIVFGWWSKSKAPIWEQRSVKTYWIYLLLKIVCKRFWNGLYVLGTLFFCLPFVLYFFFHLFQTFWKCLNSKLLFYYTRVFRSLERLMILYDDLKKVKAKFPTLSVDKHVNIFQKICLDKF